MDVLDEIHSLLASGAHLKVLVIGESFLDCYHSCQIERVSSGIAVPVLRSLGKDFFLGGAANIAANLGTFVQKVGFITNCGQDAQRQRFLELLEEHHVSPLELIPTPRTNINERVYVSGQQILRHDHGEAKMLSADSLKQAFLTNVDAFDCVVLADYGRGLLTEETVRSFIEICRQKHKTVFSCSRRANWLWFQGADFLVVNREECHILANCCEADLSPKGWEKVFAQMRCRGVLNTMDRDGVVFYGSNGQCLASGPSLVTPVNESGAGDSVLALFCVLAGGAEFPVKRSVLQLLNLAGQCAVLDSKTFVLTPARLKYACFEKMAAQSFRGKVVSARTAMDLAEIWKNVGQSVVFTNGCFDLLHSGHLANLEFAAQQGQRLIVAVNSDASVRRLKGAGHPVYPETARAALLAALQFVSCVVVFDEDTAIEAISQIRPDVYVKGAEYQIRELPEAAFVKHVVFAPMQAGISTSLTLERILEMERADD